MPRHFALLSALLPAFFLTLFCSLYAFAAPADYSLQPGEIRFDGVVSAVDAGTSTLVMSVNSFTLPSGRSSVLAASKAKKILTGAARIFTDHEDLRELQISDLHAGDKIIVLAKEAGTGKDAKARMVSVTFASQASTPTAQNASDKNQAADKNQIVLQNGETRYDGKVTGVLSVNIFAISVVSQTDAGGKTRELSEPQTLNIQIGEGTQMHAREDATHAMTLSDLKIGLRVSLAGKEAGVRTIRAREIAVWEDDESKRRSLGTVQIHQAVAVLLNRGDEFQRARAFEDAAKSYRSALETAMNENDAAGQGMSYNRLGLTYEDLGQPKRALESFQKAIEIWQRIGNTNSEATTLLNLGGFYSAQKDLKAAREAVENAIRLYGGLGNNRALAIAYNQLGEIQAAQDESENAVASWQQALNLARQTQDRGEEIAILERLGLGYAMLKQNDKAEEVIGQLVAVLPQIVDKSEIGEANFRVGLAYQVLGQKEKAVQFLTQARDLWTQAGRRENADAAQKLLDKLGGAQGGDDGTVPAGAIAPAG